MIILGISAYYHDSAAAIIKDGEIIAAAQEERFTRKKQDPDFPINAIKYCLDELEIDICNVDQVVFYDKPLLKFERLLETYYSFAPRGLFSFVTAIPVWVNDKLFLKRNIIKGLQSIGEYNPDKQKLLFTEHHLSHAASAFFPSPFKQSIILTLDGVGEWATTSICLGNSSEIKILKEIQFPHSIGLLYSSFTYYLGFRVNSGEYKLMGLAPYGIAEAEETKEFINTIKSKLVTINDDGSIWLNQKYFNYATGLKMTRNKKWQKLFGFKKRNDEEEISQSHCNLAFAIQQVTEDIVLKLAKYAQSLAESDEQKRNICLAGGVALNCVANGKLAQSGLFDNIYIQPAAGDAGGALGSALAVNYIYNKNKRVVNTELYDQMNGAYLGPSFDDKEIRKTINRYSAVADKQVDFNILSKQTASLIEQGNVVGWFQGRMEFGPRALGNRSILGDARNPEMQKKLNLKIKYREGFRPFAPSVLAEDVQTYFNFKYATPYMLMVADVKESIRNILPDDYFTKQYMDRLYVERSKIPAITHVDFSARIQSVHKETNLRYWELINEFKKLTDFGVIVNTSFNVRGEPIVCTPDDAYRCFMRTEMDYLVIGDYIFSKTHQPEWTEKNWQAKMKKD